MDIIKLYDICPEAGAQGIENCEVTSVTDNTAKAEAGSVFVCIKGAHFDGHSAARQMLEKGACMIVTDHDTGCEKQFICDNTRLWLARLVSRYYGCPTKKFGMLAITGTNGKTTTAHFVKHILASLGKKCGCIGTAGNDTCSGTPKPSEHGTPTVPAATVLYSWFKEMEQNGADYCVMEASSQALAQYRIGDEIFESAGFTNLTRDHLDYHKTMENYFSAKKRLFTMCRKAVVNIDDEYGRRLADEFSDKVITYSTKDSSADLFADYIRLYADRACFMLVSRNDKKAVLTEIPMTGIYNVENALCAVGMTSALGYDAAACARTLSALEGVDGRMNTVYKGDFSVITDYAHTDDALAKMLSTLKSAVKGRLICVFGAAGDRDKEKRPMMGKAAEDHADVLVITSDNPAHEDPDDIIKAVYSGTSGKCSCKCITDRKEAIAYALDIAEKDDIVVLAGKGQEKYQIIGDSYLPFCEAEIVKNIMMRKGNKDS